ncbi:hypothetical protein VPNG_06214 [Cytospora leucostoma]|uniref:Uncharacterized protein n=1 Tax=Cytospora leucostoma TaxID=1230097 RepID=A0A423WYH1_9PEZI|nr:hypothetical protein VPNG_06214 [Cytospora leucostoma]
MPEFYLCPYPTRRDDRPYPRATKTAEYTDLVYKPLCRGKLTMEGYRWMMYLFGSENLANCKLTATDRRLNAFLRGRPGDRDHFRRDLIDEGYTDLHTRDVEYNIYAPLEHFPAYPLGRRITQQEAEEFAERYPIPTWIDRESPVYTDWTLHPKTWRGGRTEEELEDALLMSDDDQNPVDAHLNSSSDEPDSSDSDADFSDHPSPFPIMSSNAGPAGSPHTPSKNRADHTAESIARKRRAAEQPRAAGGKFAKKEKAVATPATKKRSAGKQPACKDRVFTMELTKRDAELIKDGATTVAFVARGITSASEEDLDLWAAQAAESSEDMIRLAERASAAVSDEAPAPVSTRPEAFKQMLWGERAGDSPVAAIEVLSDNDEPERVYQSANLFGEGSSRGAKRVRVVSSSNKADPQSKPTDRETALFYCTLCIQQSVVEERSPAAEFSVNYPAVEAIKNELNVPVAHRITISNVNIPLALIGDMAGFAYVVPASTAKQCVEFCAYIQGKIAELAVENAPIVFVMRTFMHAKRDFGPVNVVMREDGDPNADDTVVDQAATIRAWIAAYGRKLSATIERQYQTRLLAIHSYIETHGIIKAFALTFDELCGLALDVSDEDVEAVFGKGADALEEDLAQRY